MTEVRPVCRVPAGGVRVLQRTARQQRPGLVQAAQGGLRGRSAGTVPRADHCGRGSIERSRVAAGRRSRARHFPIYRDVRFSPDKRLYKTHAGAVLTRSGGKRDPGLLYLHVAPGESMVAAGFWHPEPTFASAAARRPRRSRWFPGDRRGLAAAGPCPATSAEPPAARFRGGQGHTGRRIFGWKSFTAHAALTTMRCSRRPWSTASSALPGRPAAARMGLGGYRRRDADDGGDPCPSRPLPKPDF